MFSRDGTLLGDDGDGIWVFDLRAGKILRQLEIESQVNSLASIRDAKLLAAERAAR